jgi:predicted NAD-dependent protein-ADP-ribosyltransferase YbiA (DUF1768 family)
MTVITVDDYTFFSLPDEDQPFARFCQWYPSMFTDDEAFPGVTFTTAEQYMMLGKVCFSHFIDATLRNTY